MSSPTKNEKAFFKARYYAPETMAPTTPSPPPESRTSDKFLQFEGTTTFSSTTFRYSLTLQSGTLRIWVEDCESKEQWCTTKLSTEDYVDSTNAIPNATASDYVKYFHELLSDEATGKLPVTPQRLKEGVLRLKLTVRFQVLMQSRATTYTFDLEPICLERVDVLESKVRDVKEKVDVLRHQSEGVLKNYEKETKELQTKVKKLEGAVDKREAEISQLEGLLSAHGQAVTSDTSASTKTGELVLWGSDTAVKVSIPGTYQVTAIINYTPSNANGVIELQKNSTCIQSVYAGYDQGYSVSSTLMTVTSMETNDMLSVKCDCYVTLVGTSYLILVRIGK